MTERYRNREWLERKYHGEGLTQREIAEECGVSPRTIRKYMTEFGIETRELVGENHPMYGRERSEEVRRSISEALEGRTFSEETRRLMAEAHRGQELPEEVKEKISESLTGITRPEETRRKMSESRMGEKNPGWKGGGAGQYGPYWPAARRHVRERDEVCQHCGHDGSERRLEVHHIIPVRLFNQSEEAPLKDAHDESNLVLLCHQCHLAAEDGRFEFESGIEHPLDG